MTFDQNDIKSMKEGLKTFGLAYASKTPNWLFAFALYNSSVEIKDRLGVGCMPCYAKVLSYIERNHSKDFK